MENRSFYRTGIERESTLFRVTHQVYSRAGTRT